MVEVLERPAPVVPAQVALPPLRSLLGSVGVQVLEGTVVPALLFWAVLQASGLVWALLAGLAWCYLAIARRWVSGACLPAALVLGALLFTTRTGVALAFSSTFVFLLTPTVNAFVLATAFAGSALLRRPLTERFARDLVGLPPEVTSRRRVQRTLRTLCLVWAGVDVVNGGVALQLLVDGHLGGVLLFRSLVSPLLTALAIGCCVALGRRALRAEGIHLHWRWRDA